MVSKRSLVLLCQMAVWVVLAFWASNAAAASSRYGYDTATPHAPPYRIHKYIPLHDASNFDSEVSSVDVTPPEDTQTSSRMPPSQIILTALRTILDVVRNINSNKARAAAGKVNSTSAVAPRSLPHNATSESGRGYHDEDTWDYDEHYHETTTTAKPMKQGRYTDPWAGYYDWIINEGSFKFWSVFQLFTAALLLYACLSAIYYAKFNPIIPDYDRQYDDYFLERTVGRKTRSLDSWELPSGLSWINPQTFQFIMDAISQHYSEE